MVDVSKQRRYIAILAAFIVFFVSVGAAPVKAAGSSDGTLTIAYGYWDYSMVTGLMDSLLFQVKIHYMYFDDMDGTIIERTRYEIFADIDISDGSNYIAWDRLEYEHLVSTFVSQYDWSTYPDDIDLEMVIYPLYGNIAQSNTLDYIASFSSPYTYQEAVRYIIKCI